MFLDDLNGWLQSLAKDKGNDRAESTLIKLIAEHLLKHCVVVVAHSFSVDDIVN